MTIDEAKVRLLATLNVLNELSKGLGSDLRVIDARCREVFLTEESMEKVVEMYPEIKTVVEPLGDEFHGKYYLSMTIADVQVFTIKEGDV